MFASLSRPVVQGQLEAKAIALQEAKVNDVSRTFSKALLLSMGCLSRAVTLIIFIC
jgi:hypothetical protein